MRLLQRLRHEADAKLGQDRLLDLHVPEFALDVVGRILGPDAQDHVDRFHEGALARGRVDLEQLEVRGEAAGADAEQKRLRSCGRTARLRRRRWPGDGSAG